MNTPTLHWLAGLLEGEGCFCYDASPGIKLGMTDRDVIDKVAVIFGKQRARGPYKYKVNKKPVYYTEIWGNPAIELMQKLLPLMGQRRSEKIEAILAKRAKAPGPRHRLGKGRKPRCHPDREHYADWMCRLCYRKDRRQKGWNA